MKSKAAALCMLLVLSTAGVSHAVPEFWLGGSAGTSITGGSADNGARKGAGTLGFKDVAHTGYEVGGIASCKLSRLFSVGLDAGYHSWKGTAFLNKILATNSSSPQPGGFLAEGKWSALQATAHGQLNLPLSSTVTPFVRLGAGLYNVTLATATDLNGDSSEKKSKVGFNGGLGARLRVNDKMAVEFAGLYHHVSFKKEFFGDVTAMTFQASLLWKAGAK